MYNIWLHKNRVTGMPFYIFMVRSPNSGPKAHLNGYPWAKTDRESRYDDWAEAAKDGFECELISQHDFRFVAEARKHELIQSYLGIGVPLVNARDIGPIVKVGMETLGLKDNGMRTLGRANRRL